jgi:hypothetical protein
MLPKGVDSRLPSWNSWVQGTLLGDQPGEEGIKDMALGRRCHESIPTDHITVFGQYGGTVISTMSDHLCVEYESRPGMIRTHLEGCLCWTATK